MAEMAGDVDGALTKWVLARILLRRRRHGTRQKVVTALQLKDRVKCFTLVRSADTVVKIPLDSGDPNSRRESGHRQ